MGVLPKPSSRYTATDRINSGRNEESASATESPCSGSQTATSASIDAGCSAVADEHEKQGRQRHSKPYPISIEAFTDATEFAKLPREVQEGLAEVIHIKPVG